MLMVSAVSVLWLWWMFWLKSCQNDCTSHLVQCFSKNMALLGISFRLHWNAAGWLAPRRWQLPLRIRPMMSTWFLLPAQTDWRRRSTSTAIISFESSFRFVFTSWKQRLPVRLCVVEDSFKTRAHFQEQASVCQANSRHFWRFSNSGIGGALRVPWRAICGPQERE